MSSPIERLYVTPICGSVCKEVAMPIVEQAIREYGALEVILNPLRYTGLSWEEVKEPLIELRVYPLQRQSEEK
jgi:hypothetical protein